MRAATPKKPYSRGPITCETRKPEKDRSVAYPGLGLLSQSHPFFHADQGGRDACEALLGVDGGQGDRKVLGVAVLQLLDGVHAAGFEQFGKLWTDTVDAHQVGQVGPAQDLIPAQLRDFDHFTPALRIPAEVQQVFGGCDAGLCQFARVFGADALYIGDAVVHDRSISSP